jgi:uncharacterized protein (TIGR02996 family)
MSFASASQARLFADILAHPDDDGPRLAYAAALDQTGDPQGEFIRLSIALANRKITAVGLERWQALMAHHAAQWLAPVAPLVDRAYFDRGLVAHVVVDGTRFLQHAAQLFQLAPIRHVDLTDAKRVFAALCTSPFVGRVRSLDVKRNDLDDADISRFAASSHVGELRWLNLVLNRIDVPGLEALAASTTLRNLLFVGFGGNLAPDPIDHESVDWDGTRHDNPAPPIQRTLEQKYGRKAWLHPPSDAPDRYRL